MIDQPLSLEVQGLNDQPEVVRVQSTWDSGLFNGYGLVDVVLRKGNTFVQCKGVKIWNDDPESVETAFYEWIKLALTENEGYTTWQAGAQDIPDLTTQTYQVEAAAQDLYDALESLAGLFDTPIARRKYADNDFYQEAIAMTRAALRKAGKNDREY